MEYDFEKRKKILKYLDSDELTNFIVHYGVLYFMPLEFIEGFKRISKIVSEKLKENQPEKIISSFGCMLDTYGSILCSEASKIGTKIIGQQHGGAYHELKTSYFYNTELSFFDQFCTWV